MDANLAWRFAKEFDFPDVTDWPAPSLAQSCELPDVFTASPEPDFALLPFLGGKATGLEASINYTYFYFTQLANYGMKAGTKYDHLRVETNTYFHLPHTPACRGSRRSHSRSGRLAQHHFPSVRFDLVSRAVVGRATRRRSWLPALVRGQLPL